MTKLPEKALNALVTAVKRANHPYSFDTVPTLARTLHASTREAIIRRDLVTATDNGQWALTDRAIEIVEDEMERREHDANEAAATTQPVAKPSVGSYDGEWGVFTDEGCIFVGSRAEAEAQAADERAEDDGHWAELISVHRICPDHEEQPKDACEECATDIEADEDTEPEPVHMSNMGGTLCGQPGPDTAGTGHVDCEDCREQLAGEADRAARGVSLCWVWDVATDECDCADCEALHADDQERYEETPAEGRVITHAGSTLGTFPEHADNPTARAAIATLTAAGFTPVTVTGEFDPEPGDGTTGFYVEVRHPGTPDEIVYVHDVQDGTRTWKRDEDSKLSGYAKALGNAGWSIPTGTSKVVRALSPIEPTEASHAGALADNALSEMYNHPTPGTVTPAVVGFATEVGTVDLSEDGHSIDGVRYPATSAGFTAFADELERRTKSVDHSSPSELVRTFIGNGRHYAGLYATAENMGKARAEVLMSASSTGRLTGHPASLRALVAKDLAAEVQENGRAVFYVTPLGTSVAKARTRLDAARATA